MISCYLESSEKMSLNTLCGRKSMDDGESSKLRLRGTAQAALAFGKWTLRISVLSAIK